MKKILFAALCAAATITMASCSDDEVIESQKVDPNAMSYDVTVNNTTRTADNYGSSSLPDRFSLFAYIANSTDGATEYIYDEEIVKGTSGSWTNNSGLVRYWPELGSLTPLYLYAFVNANRSGNSESLTTTYTPVAKISDYTYSETKKGKLYTYTVKKLDGMRINNYAIDSVASKHRDLMYAINNYTDRPTNGKASLNFRHALAQMVFKVKNVSKTYYVVVEDIAINNVINTDGVLFDGVTYNSNNKPVNSDTNGQITSSSTYTTDCVWDNSATLTKADDTTDGNGAYTTTGYTAMRDKREKVAYFNTDGTAKTYGIGYSGDADADNTDWNLAKSFGSMYLIPQYVYPWDPTNSTQVSAIKNLMFANNLTSSNDAETSGSTTAPTDGLTADNLHVTRKGINLARYAYFTLKCRIYNVSNTGTGYQSASDMLIFGKAENGGVDEDGYTVTNYLSADIMVPIPIVTTPTSGDGYTRYEEGKCYTYTFVFGGDGGNGGFSGDDPEYPVLIPITIQVDTFDDFITDISFTADFPEWESDGNRNIGFDSNGNQSGNITK